MGNDIREKERKEDSRLSAAHLCLIFILLFRAFARLVASSLRLTSRTSLPAFYDIGGSFALPKVGRVLHRAAAIDGGVFLIVYTNISHKQKRKKVGLK